MSEKYTEPGSVGTDAAFSASEVRALLERLLPRANGALLIAALLAEDVTADAALVRLDADTTVPARELMRVRRQYRAGEVAQAVHLAMSNTLTALQTEAQLLELEPLADDHRRASTRIVELTRRLATVMRRLDAPDASARSG